METLTFELNRTLIIGPIDHKTPICVLKEILQAHGGVIKDTHGSDLFRLSITLKDAIKSIKIRTVTCISNEFSRKDLSEIARWVNPTATEWTTKTLIAAFNHLWAFVNSPPILPVGEWSIGQKKQSDPNTYNCCMLYSICRYYNLKVPVSASIEDLATIISTYKQSEDLLRSQVLDLVKTMTLDQMTNLITVTSYDRDHSTTTPKPPPDHTSYLVGNKTVHSEGVISHLSLDEAYESLCCERKVLSRAVPRNNSEAIILGVLVYKINLKMSSRPMEEINHLERITLNGLNGTGAYIPLDSKFRKIYLRNPEYFNPEKYWTPDIPKIYSQGKLQNLALEEGYSRSEIEANGPLNILQWSRVIPTFYSGKHPALPADTNTAINLDDINTLDNKQVVSYGNDSTQEFVLYRCSELAEQFKHELNFINPAQPKENFSDVSIRKLKLILEFKVGDTEISGLIMSEIRNLLDAINTVIMFKQKNAETAMRLRAFYLKQTSDVQVKIVKYLTSVFELAMYMRGWKVSSKDYPIISSQSYIDESKSCEVMINVTNGFSQLHSYRENITSSICKLLDELKLVRMTVSAEGPVFTTCLDPEQGLNIIGRLNIVRENKTTQACIRLTSNILTATSYYYMTALGVQPQINIGSMDTIS